MRRWTKRSLIVIAAIMSLFAMVVGARAVTGSGDDPNSASGKNVVVEIVKQDGRSASQTGFSLKRSSQDTVDNVNAAAATSAGCSDCNSIAVAVQVVLMTGSPSTVAPRNYAIALNTNCFRCGAMALAYQDVVTTGGPVYFKSDANTQMSSIESQIKDAADSGGSFPEIRAQIDGLVHQLWGVVATEMQHAGEKYEADPGKDVDVDRTGSDGCPTGATDPAPAATEAPLAGSSPTPSPTGSATPCPTPSDVTASPDPSDAATPAPTPACTGSPTSDPTPEPTPTSVGPTPCPLFGESPSPLEASSPEPATTTVEPSPTADVGATQTPTPAPSASSG